MRGRLEDLGAAKREQKDGLWVLWVLVSAHRYSVVLVLFFKGRVSEVQAMGPFVPQLVNFRYPKSLTEPAAAAFRWEGHR